MCAQLSGTLTEPAFPRPDCPCMGARSQWIRVTASFCYYDTETGGSHKYVDAIDSVLLVHGRTGHVRVGPWICLRNEYGCVYLANLITRVTRWFPPKLWIWRTSPGRPSSTSTCLPTGRRLGVHCALPGLSTCATIKADPPRQPNDGRRRCTVPELHWSAALARFVRQRPTFPIKGHYERANGTQWKKI